MSSIDQIDKLHEELYNLISDYRYQTNTEEVPGDLYWIHGRIDLIEQQIKDLEAAQCQA
jgi:hypothetical protein